MQNGCVVFVELFCDGGQRERSEFSGEIHGDLSREGNIGGPALAGHVGDADVVIIGDNFLNLIDGDRGAGFLRKERTQQRISQLDGHEIRFVIGHCQIINQLQQSAFEATDVGFYFAGKMLQDRITEFDCVILLLLTQDGNAGLEVRRLNIDRQTAFEPGNEAFFEAADFAWRTVGGENDLLMSIIEGIEGMEEDFLESFLAGEEVDVINQQDIDVSEVLPEFRKGFTVQGVDIEVAEFFAEEIFDFGAFVILADSLSDGLQQVCFSQAGGAVNEEGIVNGSR